MTLDIWDRAGLQADRSTDDPRAQTIKALESQGFTSVVAVNSELEVVRYLRPGDVLQNVQILEDVSEEKATGLGVGHFVTTRHRYTTAEGEHVGDLLFRILKFRPGTGRTPRRADGAPAGSRPFAAPAPAARHQRVTTSSSGKGAGGTSCACSATRRPASFPPARARAQSAGRHVGAGSTRSAPGAGGSTRTRYRTTRRCPASDTR